MDLESRNGMDNTILYVMMICVSLFNAIIPFAVFLGLGTILGSESVDGRLLLVALLAILVCTFLSSLGAFALIQKESCGSVQNMKQVANNAGLALGIQTVVLFIVWLIPFFRNIVSGMLPPDIDPKILDAMGWSYFAFFGSLFGVSIGGTLSGMCK